jgi:hypothetical protein
MENYMQHLPPKEKPEEIKPEIVEEEKGTFSTVK